MKDMIEVFLLVSMLGGCTYAVIHESTTKRPSDNYKYQVYDLDYYSQGYVHNKILDANNCIQTNRKYVCGTFTILENRRYFKFKDK